MILGPDMISGQEMIPASAMIASPKRMEMCGVRNLANRFKINKISIYLFLYLFLYLFIYLFISLSLLSLLLIQQLILIHTYIDT